MEFPIYLNTIAILIVLWVIAGLLKDIKNKL